MSHFSVLTIGNPQDVLAPFCEQDEEYFTAYPYDMDRLKKDYKKYRRDPKYKEFLKKHPELKNNLTAFAQWWEDFECFAEYDDQKNIASYEAEKKNYGVLKNGNLVALYRFNNPNAKWDWYQDGGRFSSSEGHYIFKDGTSADSGLVKDLDIDAMIEDAKKHRAEKYDKMLKKFGRRPKLEINWGVDIKPLLNQWSDIMKKHDYDVAKDICDWKGEMVKKLIEFYHNQPEVVRWKKIFKDNFWLDIEDFCCSREEYIENYELPLWAICDEDGWHEPTEMGLWAMHDDYDVKSWRDHAIEILKKNIKKAQEEDPDLTITLIDCHI